MERIQSRASRKSRAFPAATPAVNLPPGVEFSHQPDILPHTTEAGDHYYIGDVYHRFNCRKQPNPYPIPPPPPSEKQSSSASTSTNFSTEKQVEHVEQPPVTLGPYHAHVRKLGAEWLDIGYLAQWMEVTTQPTKLRFLSDADKLERANRTKVTVLDFDDKFQHSRRDYNNPEELKMAFNSNDPSGDGNNDVNIRLVIVEDLSQKVIETLGARFDIDPLFFRQQISDYTWYNNRDPWVEMAELDLLSQQRPFFHINYVQSRYFRTSKALTDGRAEAGHFNVLRRLDVSGKATVPFDLPDSNVAMVRTNMSLWVRQNKDGETGWLGILLVDPPLTQGQPLWGGYRSFSPPPSMHDPDVTGPPRTSILEDVVYWLTHRSPSDFSLLNSSQSGFMQLLIRRIVVMVCTEWLTMMSHATARLALIEWEIESPEFLSVKDEGLNDSLLKLHPWRRRLPFYHRMVSAAFNQVAKRPNLFEIPAAELDCLRPDFEHIQQQLRALMRQADKIVTVVTAIISIQESRKATQQNKGVSRLTYIALTFAPLSFLSSFFSMTGDLGQLRQTFWIYFVVGIPLTAILLLIARFSREFVFWKAKKKGTSQPKIDGGIAVDGSGRDPMKAARRKATTFGLRK